MHYDTRSRIATHVRQHPAIADSSYSLYKLHRINQTEMTDSSRLIFSEKEKKKEEEKKKKKEKKKQEKEKKKKKQEETLLFILSR